MKNIILTAMIVVSQISWADEFITGTILKKESDYYIKSSELELKIDTTEVILKSIPSLYDPKLVTQSNNQPYTFEFKGEENGESFKLSEVPTNIAGAVSLKGILLFDSNSQTYSIDGHEAIFGYTKKSNGYEFDEISKKYFVGKNLIVEGNFNERGFFVMMALAPLDLFTATPSLTRVKYPLNFIVKEMPKNDNSKKYPSFKTTIFEDSKLKIRPGDGALIITMSGRQGDTFGAVNGHFTVGTAEVREDLSLRGELSNGYFTNSKDILSGNTSLMNYFSHIVQGQNVYRPTYTIVVYGIDKKNLKKYRDGMQTSLIRFRTEKNLVITPQFNCTTESLSSLKEIGIEGEYFQLPNTLEGLITSPLKLNNGIAGTLQYALGNNPSRYQPVAAFESLVKTFLNEKNNKKIGVKRVDYIFYSQIPSGRPVGGMALGSIWKVAKFKKLTEKYEVNESTKLGLSDLKMVLERELKEIPYQ